MLLQNARIGKTAVFLLILIFMIGLATVPLLLQAEATGEPTSDESLFLPIILNEGEAGTINPTSTLLPTNTPTVTGTPTHTSTPTITPISCDVQFESPVSGGDSSVDITGDVGINVSIINLTKGITIGMGTIEGPIGGHICEGFSTIPISPPLSVSETGDVLLVMDSNNPDNSDTTIVNPFPTITPSPTNTPTVPYIVVLPNCAPGPDIQFIINGGNWPTDQSITILWEDSPQTILQANQHPGFFSFTWTFTGLSSGYYTASALSGTNGATASDTYSIPCGLPTITPTSPPTPITPTPVPADLIVGQPVLISTPPAVVYEPVTFEVPITNTGDIAIDTLFFVDVLFDPEAGHYSEAYTAVSSLAGNSTVTLTITSPIGFANFAGTHEVIGWVDSFDHAIESDESNNLSDPLEVTVPEFGMTPTSTPLPNGSETISGVVHVLDGTFLRMERAAIEVVDETSGLTIGFTYSDENGFYSVENIPNGSTYTVQTCIIIDNTEFFGLRTNRSVPDPFADIFVIQGPCS